MLSSAGKRVEAEAALAALAATVTERGTSGPPPPSPITVRRGSPAAAAAAENALTAHVSKVPKEKSHKATPLLATMLHACCSVYIVPACCCFTVVLALPDTASTL
jgi:hypothetical protein